MSVKIVGLQPETPRRLEMKDIPYGYFVGTLYEDQPVRLFIATYEGVISADSPKQTWATKTLVFYKYRPVNVTITITSYGYEI